MVEATGDTEFARQFFTSFENLAEFRVIEIKRQILDLADGVGSAVTGFFIVMGLFSIMVGVLLIFLIFVMLAAARRSEMGMARAIGAKRSHLVQMFVFEGTAYSILAGAVGVGLGLVASIAIVSIANRIFAGGGEEDFQLTRHFEVRSAVVAYCLGMVITFLTVGISAFRVSRLNIVAAVRGLPPPPDTSQPALRGQLMEPVRVLLRPGRFIGQSVAALVSLHPGRALSLLLQSGWAAVTVPAGLAAAVTQLLWGPFSQGWLARGRRRAADLGRHGRRFGRSHADRDVPGHRGRRPDGPLADAPRRGPPGISPTGSATHCWAWRGWSSGPFPSTGCRPCSANCKAGSRCSSCPAWQWWLRRSGR